MNTNENPTKGKEKYTNALIHENSPYLLQHAHNPVNWLPWGEAAFKKAKEENKPLLISIGYAACHWCHVMEEESFEDTNVAKLMNENFVCIKVDREERPDIDQVYMNAVQLMTGRGGWPLNCFATPDGRPFYGGTYFPKDKWMQILHQLSNIYQNEPEKIEEYANKLTEGVRNSELITLQKDSQAFSIDSIQGALKRWIGVFDLDDGGNNQAPKFPMPNTYEFLLQYQYLYPNEAIAEHIKTSLKKMAYGGIYDQVGGGFARYSTDMKWKVPHFEKMLYDNAQLLSLYSEAYRWNKNPLYKDVVNQTITFVNRELKSSKNAYYSSLDADSEGEEGKYYVWTEKELKALLGDDFSLAKDYFNINSNELWEGNYILLRNKDDQDLAAKTDMKVEAYRKKIEEIKTTLLQAREKRIKPALDDKSLTSWNSLMIKGLCDAYLSFGNAEYLKMAKENANFIIDNQLRKDGRLNHSYRNGKSSINGYLEDYSFTIEAFVALYEVSFDEKWLDIAHQLAQYSIQHFFDEKSHMFYFTSDEDPQLISRKMEVMDNVIPSSNSSMAKGLFRLGLLLENQDYLDKSKQMLRNMQPQINKYLPNTTNWGSLLLSNTSPFYELAIVGKNAQQRLLEFSQHYLPNKLILGVNNKNSTLPLLEMKWVEGQTTLYVCENKVCQSPVTKVEKAVEQMEVAK